MTVDSVGRGFSRPSAGCDDMACALGLPDNIGLKGLGVSGNSCETVGVAAADMLISPP